MVDGAGEGPVENRRGVPSGGVWYRGLQALCLHAYGVEADGSFRGRRIVCVGLKRAGALANIGDSTKVKSRNLRQLVSSRVCLWVKSDTVVDVKFKSNFSRGARRVG